MPLAPEEAYRRLSELSPPGGTERMVRRVRRLRGDLRDVATGLLPFHVRSEDEREVAPTEVGAWLDATSDRQRRKLFRVLHRPLGDLLADTWTATATDPYTVGAARRPFRAPGDAAHGHRSRVETFQQLLWTVAEHEHPPAWFAAWAPYLAGSTVPLGRMLAVAMDRGDTDVREVLHATVAGEHEVGRMDRHVTAALLTSRDPEDWERAERLLVGAQREEGLRSVILESVDLAQPAAFRRMLELVREQRLTRFASTLRAVGVWFGAGFEVSDRSRVDGLLGDVACYLDDPAAREAAIAGDDPGRVQLGLWAAAFEDAPRTVPRAVDLLEHRDPDVRVAAAHLLVDSQLPTATRALLPRLAGDDTRLAALAHLALARDPDAVAPADLEGAARTLLARSEGTRSFDFGILRSEPGTFDPRDVADLVIQRTPAADLARVEDIAERCSAAGRAHYARQLGEHADQHRDRLLSLLSDRSGWVQNVAFASLGRARPPTEAEAPRLEALLRRKAAGTRTGVIGLLLRQPDDAVVASIERLRGGVVGQRAGALELLRELLSAGRGGAAADRVAAEVVADDTVPEGDRRLLADLHAPASPRPGGPGDAGLVGPDGAPGRASAGDGTEGFVATGGLVIDDAARTPAVAPSAPQPDLGPWRTGIERVLTSLDAWLAEHRDVEVTVDAFGQGPQVMLVSDLRYLATPDPGAPWPPQADKVPLPGIVEPWWERTAGQLTDDGLEALLAWGALLAGTSLTGPAGLARVWGPVGRLDPGPEWPRWYRKATEALSPVGAVEALQYEPVLTALLPWYTIRAARVEWIPPLLELAEAALAAVPSSATKRLPSVHALVRHRWDAPPLPLDWRTGTPLAYLQVALGLEALRPELFDPEQRGRLWRCVRFVDEPQGVRVGDGADDHLPARDRGRDDDGGEHGLGHDGPQPSAAGRPAGERPPPRRPARRQAPIALTVRAIEDGVADRADLLDLLARERWPMADRTQVSALHGYAGERPLADLTRRRRPALLDDHPWLAEVVHDVRGRIVTMESGRGDLPTPVSDAALQLRSVPGAATVTRLLATLGKQSLVRGWTYGGDLTKPAVLSHLIRVCFPATDDTPATFAAAAEQARLSEKRLLELSVYAPQWAPSVEHALGWPGLTDGVHWLHAHTKDDRWQVDEDVRDEWAAVTAERTPLTADELLRGHVDVDWFTRTLGELGEERFDRLAVAAKLASSSGGHKRAQLFADALRGTLDRAALDERITTKRHQDSVRALGLLPLPASPASARAEVLARYEQLVAWQQAGGNFGAQRRASEAVAVDVAMANLARNAGYADPQRLRWAMEAEATRDLAAGPVTVTEDDVTVTLSLTEEGAPQLDVVRGERSLKRIPKAVAKREAIAALKERVTHLKDQAKRMRASLETAMVRGETFTPGELAELLAHPTLAPILRRLVLVTDGGDLGHADRDGEVLVDQHGAATSTAGALLRVAHPVDLLVSDRWHEWQHAAFDARLRQPFKQLFRELYVLTAAEQDGATHTDRYAGHQIAARQAIGILKGRGWVMDREHGPTRTYHDDRLTVRAGVLDGMFTAVEAADMMLGSVTFHEPGSWSPMPLDDVPPRLFSEAMRDLDLIVSVAHSGGVDPEATASTIEMRAALTRETAEMLGLDNVELTDHHALIAGSLGSYSVHLGSGTVHRRPGNAVCIVPVGAQHRGRLFLPFVDDDPRTAEVVSKVVLLARDERIKDPTILEQLR